MGDVALKGQVDDKINMIDHYNTYDLGVAAALSVLGFEIVEMDKTNPKRVKFVFKADGRKGGIEAFANTYFNHSLELPAQRFFTEIKVLKSRIYSDN